MGVEQVEIGRAVLINADCRGAMAAMEPGSVDAIVTDPPYGLEFMGKSWDKPWAAGFSKTGYSDKEDRLSRPSFSSNRNPVCRTCHKHKRGAKCCRCAAPDFDETPRDSSVLLQRWHESWAREALRVLKPGGHLLAFGGTRTFHRLACAIEDAGFEIRDTLCWLYGSGFPKSLDVSKAIDKAAGAERRVVGVDRYQARRPNGRAGNDVFGADNRTEWNVTAPATDAARQWQGWGTALKPAFEPIILARSPLAERNVAANVLAHGTGALNVDGCRVAAGPIVTTNGTALGRMSDDAWDNTKLRGTQFVNTAGRWPANVVLSHTADCREVGTRRVKGDSRVGGEGSRPGGFVSTGADNGDGKPAGPLYGDTEVPAWECAPGCAVRLLDEQSGELSSGVQAGGAYPRSAGIHAGGQRTDGTTSIGDTGGASRFYYVAKADTTERGPYNNHPTVKPIALMRWLIRLITPPGGTVLDCFAGSGTSLIAALHEGFDCIGIERDAHYCDIIERRLYDDAPLFNRVATP